MKLQDAINLAAGSTWHNLKTSDEIHHRASVAGVIIGMDRDVRRIRDFDLGRAAAALSARGLAPGTVNRHLAAVAGALRAGGNPDVRVPWLREPKGRVRWLTAAEVQALSRILECDRGPVYGALVRFLAETGLRVGEALGLEWSEVHLDCDPRVVVRWAKNGDSRTVPLTAPATGVLNTLSRSGAGPFTTVSQSSLNHAFRKARDEVASTRGDREVVPHALRHTCASRLTRAGVPLPVVAAWLGHRDHRSTLRYVHVDMDGLRNAARMVEGQ